MLQSVLWRRLVEKIASHAILLAFSFCFFIPLLWMVLGAFKTPADLNATPVKWFTHDITWDNFSQGVQTFPMGRYVLNTLIIAVPSMIGAAVSSSFIAYGLARIDWPLRKPLFVVILATMMIPYYVTMVPLFQMFKAIGWVGTFLPLIAPHFFGVAFYVFLLRQFYMGIPRSLTDAARVDGVSEIGIWWRIVLPLSRPALAAVMLFQFLISWSDLLGPLLYLSNSNLYTVSLGLTYFRGEYATAFGPLMAVSAILIVPVAVVFFLAQRTFIQGITLSGIKE
ncbi:sugar ABC transporter ATP-binding protein [Mangrovactinospora gilvigrisea]|uniref:Sugar ABC transporter ATP-binding protein n=1 Tax=Mangrovactinospora gilvigrisea TaxID=1428644 RepID=A0A1J7C5H6_9ACTN|nr:carbohydrate ABC transporter permease [Mangrovactinospora gilvigrisea]OIV36796.1 sugar ABC transporter ATP-binding protein [Mangrovactinospora gilvigrisea]